MHAETTALGAAMLAGMQVGLMGSPADIVQRWRREARFDPAMCSSERLRRCEGWRDAVQRTRSGA